MTGGAKLVPTFTRTAFLRRYATPYYNVMRNV